jgi:hypothetical protein
VLRGAVVVAATSPEIADGSLVRVTEYLGKLVGARFWGNVTLRIDGGKIVVVKEERTRRPEEL